MKVTLKDLWNARSTLQKLAGTHFKAKTAYHLMKLIDQANKELEPFGKVRQELFQKYGEEKDERITVKADNMEAFKQEMEELENQEVELKFAVTLDEIGDAQLTPTDLFDLQFLFEDVATPQ